VKIAIFIWVLSVSNYIIQGFLRIRGKEVPVLQADIKSVQLLIDDVWTLALQFCISELLRSILFCLLDYTCTIH